MTALGIDVGSSALTPAARETWDRYVQASLGPEATFIEGPYGVVGEGADALVFCARLDGLEVVVKCVCLDESLDPWWVYQVSQQPDRAQPIRGVARCLLVGKPVLPDAEVVTRAVVVQERVLTLPELAADPQGTHVGRLPNAVHAEALELAATRAREGVGYVDAHRPGPGEIAELENRFSLRGLACHYFDDLVHGLIVQSRRLISLGLCRGIDVVDLHPGNVGIAVRRPVRPQAVTFDDVLSSADED